MRQKLDGRLKTMLQSVDTARYQGDNDADRMTDISHARSEVLSAMLFGYEIALPAGAIADCPALIELIPEVFECGGAYGARPYIRKIRKELQQDYKLFRIGLEDKYRSFKGSSGYSAFIADYLESKLGSAPTMVALVELAEATNWHPQAVTGALGVAYLNRDWTAIDSLGDDIAAATGDDEARRRMADYRRYAQCIHTFLETGDHTSFAARPLYSESSFISSLSPSHFHDNLQHLVDISRNREIKEHTEIDDNRRTFERIFDDIQKRGMNPAERGSWYDYRQAFDDEGMWGYTRNWLDVILYDHLRSGFEVSVPSYFSQELKPSGDDCQMTLSLASYHALSQFTDAARKEKNLPHYQHPADMEVDWEAIWEVISEKTYQNSLNAMTERYREALNRQWEQFEELQARGSSAINPDSLRRIAEDRTLAMNAAFNDHLEYLNEKFLNFKLLNQNGKIIVGSRPKIGPKRLTDRLVNMATAGSVPDSEGIASWAVDFFSGEFADQVTEQFWRTDINRPNKIDVVARPSNIEVDSRKSFIDAERNRINFWITGG